MGSSPEFGVVDPECRLFGCDNLYIAGSAVFPTASFVNPTLTIVALAYRMANDLKETIGIALSLDNLLMRSMAMTQDTLGRVAIGK